MTGLLLFAAAQTVSLALAATDPPSPGILHNHELAYIRIHYQSDAPVRIRATPYSNGRVARGARTSGSPLYNAGEGDALASFDFQGAASVDAIELRADDGRAALATVMVPVSLTWDGALGAARTPDDWVAPLQATVHELERADQMRATSSSGSDGFGFIFAIAGLAALAAVLAGFVWPIWAVIRWRGNWRAAAALPLAAAALWTLKDAVDLARDATSHNLLPFEYLMGAAIAAPYMAVVGLARRLTRR